MLRLDEAPLLLKTDYLPVETGCGLASDGFWHVAASTYMPRCTAKMIDWWFGFIHTTDQYKLWHPRDHVWSDWDGPRENKSEYIGGHHLVHEYIGGELSKLRISFKSPADFFGANWQAAFEAAGYSTAVCGVVSNLEAEDGESVPVSYLIHLVKDEPDGCRMRSRFWLGEVEGDQGKMGAQVPESLKIGLMKHATEEMAILASQLPALYQRFRRQGD
jgi:hypothetical protein